MTTANGNYTSCLRHKENKRFFILFEDFLLICGGEYAQAAALRVLETKTNDRLVQLRDEPRRTPHVGRDRLFLSISYADFKRWSLGIYRESSYQDALVLLEQRGFVESRAVKVDDAGKVIKVYPVLKIVEDSKGRILKEYDFNGDKSYVKQYRLKSDAVNKAIDALDPDLEPEDPQHEGEVTEEEKSDTRGGNLTDVSAPSPQSQDTTVDPPVKSLSPSENNKGSIFVPKNGSETTRGAGDFTRGRTENTGMLGENVAYPGEITSKKEEKNLELPSSNPKKDSVPSGTALSLLRNTVDFEWLRTANWEVNTLLMLSSKLLDVPVVCDDEAWLRDWFKPAERLLQATLTLSPERAWHRLNDAIAYMTQENSPSWWVQGRARQSQVTLRHVADNYTVIDRERHNKQWYASEGLFVRYDGPNPCNDSALIETPVQPAEQAPSTAMDQSTADSLAQEILGCYPSLFLVRREAEDGGYVLGFQYAEDKWRTVRNVDTWRLPSPLLQHRLEQALAFGRVAQVLEEVIS